MTIEFPPLPSGEKPLWDGSQFMVGGRSSRVIAYSSNETGWSEGLTELHEEEAGQGQHPLDVASRGTAIDSLRRFGFPSEGNLLEVGCSSGFLLRDLRREFPRAELVGTDIALGALNRLGRSLSGVPLVQMDLLDCKLPDAQFDAIVAINVLEHIEDDAAALNATRRLLKPNGILIIEVPQGKDLYDYYDHYLKHFRRYSKPELAEKLCVAGFAVERIGSLGSVPYLPFWITKKVNRMRFGMHGEKTRDLEGLVRENIKTTADSKILRLMLRIEKSGLLWLGSFPGIRCVAVARVNSKSFA